MTELERRIREAIAEFCTDMCAQSAGKALLAVLDRHRNDDDDHMCVKNVVGHTVQAWYDGEDCPTVVEIGRGLGLVGEED